MDTQILKDWELGHLITFKKSVYNFLTERKKWSHFDLKSWVTGGTRVRFWIPSNQRIYDLNWLDIASHFYLTLNIEVTFWLSMSN